MKLKSPTITSEVTLKIVCPSLVASQVIANQMTNISLSLTLLSHQKEPIIYQIEAKEDSKETVKFKIDLSPLNIVPSPVIIMINLFRK
jgi:hypothetical protein